MPLPSRRFLHFLANCPPVLNKIWVKPIRVSDSYHTGPLMTYFSPTRVLCYRSVGKRPTERFLPTASRLRNEVTSGMGSEGERSGLRSLFTSGFRGPI